MFAGIGILGTFISTIGAKLISGELRKGPHSVADDTKHLIKERIDEIERLNQYDFDLLIRMLTELHKSKQANP
jgi:hypothetical protein